MKKKVLFGENLTEEEVVKETETVVEEPKEEPAAEGEEIPVEEPNGEPTDYLSKDELIKAVEDESPSDFETELKKRLSAEVLKRIEDKKKEIINNINAKDEPLEVENEENPKEENDGFIPVPEKGEEVKDGK